MTHFLDFLADRVLLCDGAMGTQVQARNLRIEEDFLGHENCTEILTESRPDLVREIHRGYLAAGADAIQTTTFGGSPITLGEFGLQDKAFELNKRACELAHEAIAEFKADGRTRFVIGSVGPGTRLPTLGHVAYQPLEDALTAPAQGVVAGAVDAPLIQARRDPLAQWLERFVLEDSIGMIGGCCGTDVPHIAALDRMLRRLGKDSWRPAPVARKSVWVPSIASLYGQVPLRQENAFLAIGERCNANGSRKWRQLQEKHDWDGCVEMGREQVKEGSHALDICTAFVGRDEIAEMSEVVTRMRGAVHAPLVIDSTELPVLEAALELYGGKPVLNSINFEDGEGAAEKRMILAKRFGTAVIALTIDETGMAKDVEHKVAVARRLHDFACNRFRLPEADLLFAPLTFTICTGNDDHRKLGLWTLEAIERIRAEIPDGQILLSLANIRSCL